MPKPAILSEIQYILEKSSAHPLKNFNIIHVQVVEWGDMDAFGHVNNIVYYEYAQNARIHYNEQLDLFNKNTLSVLVNSSCQYLKPVTYPDTLWIGVRVKKIGNTSITHEYRYYSVNQEAIVAIGESILVYLDKQTGQKKPIDEDKKQVIANLENW